MAFNKMSWIHSQGPLYSYGPYYGPGYVNMHIPLPYYGSYSPADPNLWNGGYGVYGSALPAPAAGYAPNAVPGYGPQSNSGAAPGPRIVPANYNPNPVRVIGR